MPMFLETTREISRQSPCRFMQDQVNATADLFFSEVSKEAAKGDPFKTRPSKKYDKAMTSGERNTVSVESPWVRLVSVTSDDDITISVESPPAPPPTSPPAPMTTGSSSMEAAVHAYVPVTSEIKVC
ncbi:hypothetical protein V6N12_013870 [Hibiscus sabdariffa]|uniref:Uncharacterized protein n=1 Tax=Hibiscus sabdariffa TaxID=183260 RepID=A0ABR2AMG2_9ROSI